jgi:attractin
MSFVSWAFYCFDKSFMDYDVSSPDTRTWSLVNTTGAIVKGGYGHSSIYDDTSGLIYVHGGYQSQSFSAYLLSDAMYAFNPNTSAW